MTATRRRERWPRIDPLTAIVGVLALIVYSVHGFEGALSRDLAVYSYGAQQVVDGVPPYVGILNRAGPLAHLIPAIGVLGARIGGIDDLLGMRLLFMLIAVVCVCLVYKLGRDLFRSPLAGLAAATAFLSFYGFIEYASNGPREKTPMVLLLLCTLLAVVKQRWLAAGFCVSLATLIWQPAFFVGSTAVVVAVAAQHSRRLRALTRFAMGGLIPAAACVLYFLAVGAFEEFIEAFVLINAEYTTANPITGNLPKNWSRLVNGYGISLWVMILGLVALPIFAASEVIRRGWRSDSDRIALVAVGAASVTGFAWTYRDFNGWPDAFVLLPLAAVGVGAMAKELIAPLPLRSAVVVTLTWAVATTGVALMSSVVNREHRLEAQRDSVEAVLGQLPPDTSILSIKAPQPLVLSGKTNPTRHQMFTGGLDLYIDDTWPGGLEGYGDWIGREEPTLIAHNGRLRPWLESTIEEEYRRVARAPGWTWYVHGSVGSTAVSALRSATSD